ncbi:hypothetical protein EZS27_026234 [termite gut metagenome]|uniref:Fimbrillin family protein n=1 Tax=termite gut metagenome TaxID=433724 RepID=A0A5J4QU51_9ZZZZ
MKKIITSKWIKISLSAIVAIMAIACNENDDDFFDKHVIILSVKTENAETRANAEDFPNAINGKAQVAVFAYTVNTHQNDNDFRIDHAIADVGNGNGTSYKLLWQEGKEQYWPVDYEAPIVFTGYNPINLKSDNDQLKISLSEGKGYAPDVIVADPITAYTAKTSVVNLSFRHVMSGLTIMMKKSDAESFVQLCKMEITVESNTTRNYDLKTGQWGNLEDDPKTDSTFVYYTLDNTIPLSSTEIVLNNTPLLFFPDMGKYVILTVYKGVSGGVLPVSMRLSDITDGYGNNILQQGKQSTLLLSFESGQLVVKECSLQDWGIINLNPKPEKIFQMEVEIQRNKVPDMETGKQISSIELVCDYDSYRISMKPFAEEGRAVTNTLQNLPENITNYQLIVHLTNGMSKKIPIGKFDYRYAVKNWNNITECLLTIEGDALD